jgi:hypothetical protein
VASHPTPDSSDDDDTGWLIASKVLLTVGFAAFLISWFISSSNALMYVILYGSVRKAKQQLVAEIVLYLGVTAVGLIGAVNWKNMLAAETLFGVWSVLVPLLILSVVIIATIEKVKTYSHLALVGISLQVNAEPEGV